MIKLLFPSWTRIFFSFLRDCQTHPFTLPRSTRGLFVPGKFVSSQRGCQNSRLIFPRTYSLRLGFFIYFLKSRTRASARFLDRLTRSGTPPFRGEEDRGDENRISLLFRLDTYVCAHTRCPGPATSSRLRPLASAMHVLAFVRNLH